MAPKLELRDVVVRHGARDVLKVASLSVAAGDVLAVIGPNGAGKSTLLQVAALVLRPARGSVLFDGEPVGAAVLPFRRRLAIAMQEAQLVQGSVLDNVALGLQLRGVSKRERRERAREWLRRFGVDGLASRPAQRLSGGEAQRVSLARAFVIAPELLLLDEPFSGLDEATRDQLLDDLGRVLSETGVTTVFVTHDRDEALRLAGRVAVLIAGRLRQEGAAEEVFGAPADEEVAAFVGVETIVTARVLGTRDGLVTLAVGEQQLTAVASRPLGPHARVCVRPEDVVIQPAGLEAPLGSARNLLWGTVKEVRPRGAEARVIIDCGFPLVAAVTRLSLAELGLAPGVKAAASIKATALHLLPVAGEVAVEPS
jgi:tungstate transport system ATP-binding protein